MSLVYFSDAGNIVRYRDHPEGGIVGEALIFYEGEHTDNQHRKHQIPPERIQLLATNTNIDYNQGRDIPLKFEHRKFLVGDDGGLNEFGKMASAVSCRPIEEADLANPRLQHLVGKLGAFATVHVLDKIDAVKNKTIKALSAGIDPVKNKFVEISAVSNPSLPGAALLFSNTQEGTRHEALGTTNFSLVPSAYGLVPNISNFSNHGITDYEEAWEKVVAWEKPHQELQKRFDVFLGTLTAIANQEDIQTVAFNPNNLKRKALEGFVEHLIDYLKIDMDDRQENLEDIYNQNAYEPEIISNKNNNGTSPSGLIPANYSLTPEDDGVDNNLNFKHSDLTNNSSVEKRQKRKKRGKN